MRVPVKAYPDTSPDRARVVVRDVVAVLLLVLFAWCGVRVHALVDGLQVLGDGVVDAGASIQGGFDAAAEATAPIPVVGGQIAEGLMTAGDATGGNLADLGRAGQDSVRRLAVALGWLVALLPSLLLLIVLVPRRVRLARDLGAASVVLADVHDPDRRRLLATRAALGLPYRTLAAYTRDPLGDLAAGRYDALVQAALDDAGIRPLGHPA